MGLPFVEFGRELGAVSTRVGVPVGRAKLWADGRMDNRGVESVEERRLLSVAEGRPEWIEVRRVDGMDERCADGFPCAMLPEPDGAWRDLPGSGPL